MSDLSKALEDLTQPVRGSQALPHYQQAARGVPVGRDWAPGVQYADTGSMTVTTPAGEALEGQSDWTAAVERMGLVVPDGWSVRLVEAKYHENLWTRENQGDDAVTKPSWSYKFRIEPAKLSAYGAEDLVAMVRDAMRRRRKVKAYGWDGVDRSLVVVYADPQTGKTGSRGTSADLVARVSEKFDKLDDHIRDLKKVNRDPESAVWLDAGDCVENFENTAQQAQTNDLTLTQQVRLHRRLTFDGLDRLAGKHSRVTAAVCASNHAQVRRGGKQVGPPGDDWGIEVMTQVADAFSRNEDSYGHVSFVVPELWRETVSVEASGTVIGLAHGHQYRPGKAVDWWQKQTFGNQPVAAAKILVTGHYHNFHVASAGSGRVHFQAPALDNGSDWWTNLSGDDSPSGMLVFTVTADGWDDLKVL